MTGVRLGCDTDISRVHRRMGVFRTTDLGKDRYNVTGWADTVTELLSVHWRIVFEYTIQNIFVTIACRGIFDFMKKEYHIITYQLVF